MRLTGDRCQCSGPPYKGCGEYFNSTAAFDKHRVGPFTHDPASRRCLTIPEMRAKGMDRNAKGFWVTHKNPFPAFYRSTPAGIVRDPLPREGVEGSPCDVPVAVGLDAPS